MGLIENQEANSKSIMKGLKVICNGESKGSECVNYWRISKKVNSNNAYELRKGETVRMCLVCPSYPYEWEGTDDMPIECNRYDPSERSYNKDEEEYKPLSPEAVAELTKGIENETQKVSFSDIDSIKDYYSKNSTKNIVSNDTDDNSKENEEKAISLTDELISKLD